MASYSLDALITKRQQLVDEKQNMIEKFDAQISDLESAIEILSGKKVWEISSETRFDDEHPDYIKSSLEEM
jgi:hypothetical protein